MTDIAITRWEHLYEPVGRPERTTWEALFASFEAPGPYLGDRHPGWTPARFEPCARGLENVRESFALCLDFDKGETIAETIPRLAALGSGLVHTTRKHQREGFGDRFRAILTLSRPVHPFEFGELWKRIAPAAGSVDPSPKDPSRFWFVPGLIDGQAYQAIRFGEQPLNPDEWLTRPDPTARVVEPVRVTPQTDVEERARRYVARMPAAVAGSGGHAATWEVALVLCRGFDLSESRALELLREYNARCEPPWNEKELAHKVASAAKQARVPSGFLLNNEREWKPRSFAGPPRDDYMPEPPEWLVSDEPDAPAREPGDDTDEIAAAGPEKPEQRKASMAERHGVVTLREVCKGVLQDLERPKSETGYTTGIADIDSLIGGLRHEHVTILGAGTSWGKSSFGVMVADENIRRGVGVLVISVEDPQLMYGRRIMARRSGVNALRLRDRQCGRSDLSRLLTVAQAAEDVPFFMTGVGKSVEQIAKGILELSRYAGVRLVICDYIQRFVAGRATQDRRNEVTHVAAVLSDAIKAAGAAGLLLSQLKRIQGREPTLDDLKESGDLENMAEHVALGYKQKGQAIGGDEPDARRLLIVPKNKDGPTLECAIDCRFNPVTASFETMASASSGPDFDRFDDYATPPEDTRYP